MRYLLLCLVMMILLGTDRFAAGPPRVSAGPQAVVASLPDASGARAWLELQRRQLLALMARPGGDEIVEARLQSWRAAGKYLAGREGVTDAKRGFIVYPPQVTLDLFLLDRAETLYTDAQRDPGDLPAVADLFEIDGQDLQLTTAAKYPSVKRAEAALEALSLPDSVLRGYRVYLLPFAMGDVSGQGGPGFALLAAEPRDEQLIPNQIEVTLSHEFGHNLHLSVMPRDTIVGLLRWRKYLSIREIGWREDGQVDTPAWAESPEETFAEDFRLLFGGSAARREPPATDAGDPRENPELASQLRGFMLSLAGHLKPADLPPWPESTPEATGDDPASSIPVLLATALLVPATGLKKRGAHCR